MGATGSKQSLTTSYCKGADADFTGNIGLQTIPDCLKHFATTIPNKDAIVFCSTVEPRHAISWKELNDRSCSMAKAFISLGVKPGGNIVVSSRNCPEYLYVTFGAMMAGARVINLVFTYKDGSDFVQAMNKIGDCALLILDPGLEDCDWNILKGILDDYDGAGTARSSKLPLLRNIVFMVAPSNVKVKTVNDLLQETHDTTGLPKINPDDIAIMFQTSGSTGIPKLVAHSHANLTSIGPHIVCEAYKPDDIYFNDRPFSWAGGFAIGVLFGQTRITVSGFCPPPEDKVSFLIDVIKKEKCTVAGMLPPSIYEIVARKDVLPEDWSLKTIWTGGQPITQALTVCLGTICRCLGTIYGGTEFLLASAMTATKPEELVDFSSGCTARGTEVKIVGKDGSVLPLNEVGEIYVRHPFLFKEYFNDPERRSTVITSDGWYKTDDYGRLNSDGYLFVEGRISDMIVSGGMNVLPSILESVLKACPGVASAVIVPVPDVKMYQTICACVTIQQECDVTEAKLREYMEAIHNDKEELFTVLPTFYMILDKFPEEANGKLSKKTLRKMAEERFAV